MNQHFSELLSPDGNSSTISTKILRKLGGDNPDPYLARGDPEISIADYVLDSAGSELGFFCFLMLGCIYILLNQVDGKIFRLKIFLMNRDFDLINNEGLVKFVNFTLNMLSWISLIMPPLALAVWGAGLIVRATDFGLVPTGGICVLLVGVSFMFFTFGLLKLKWNNFRFRLINAICFGFAFLSLTAYQYVLIFLDESSNSYFGFSTVFLNSNGLIILLLIFLNSAVKGGSIADILEHQLEQGKDRDPTRDQDFLEEVGEERANQKYFPTYADVIDLATLVDQSENQGDIGTAFGGGIQSAFKNLSVNAQRIITISLWCTSIGILVIYSYVIYWKMEESKLGFVTMISIIITDIFVYLIWNSNVVESTTIISGATILNRLLLYVFGGNYWIYGYMLLYLIYGAILSIMITKKRFPFEDVYGNINLNNINNKQTKSDLSKSPEFLLIFVTGIFIILFIFLYLIEPTGVPLLRLQIEDRNFPYYINGMYCILIVATFFSVLGTYRLFMRKKKKIEPQIHFYLKNRKFDMYWIFISVAFVFLAAIGLIVYWITQEISYFLVIVFVSIFIIAYLNAYLHYVMNDYYLFQDVGKINNYINKHNSKLGELREKVNKIKQELEGGQAKTISAESLGLAKNILETNKFKRRQTRMNQKIMKENEMLKSMKTDLTKSKVAPALSLNKNYSSNQGPAISMSLSRGNPSPQRKAEVNVKLQNVSTKVAPQTTLDPNRTMQTPHMNDDDKLIQEEMNRANKGNIDDIYEGGSDEEDREEIKAVKRGLAQDFDRELEEEHYVNDESSDEEFDLEREDDEDANEKRQKRKLKPIYDWRTEYNWFSAFFRGKLRYNDYQIMASLITAHLAIIAMAVLISIATESVVGVTIAVPLVHYTMAAFSLSKAMSTDAKPSCFEYFFFSLAYAIQYGWGIANLFISYTSEDLDPNDPGAAESGTYMVVYLIVIPFITSALSAIGKWIDDKGRISAFFLIQILLSAIQGISMLVLAYVFMTYEEGIVVSVVIVVIAYIVLQIRLYVKNDYELPDVWAGINIFIVSCVIVASTVVSFFVPGFRIFVGVSISTWILAAMILVYGLTEVWTDLRNMERKPIFFSPWVFPVYRYNAKKNDVESNNGPAAALVTGFVILITWSVVASVWIYPHNVGVSLSILFENVLLILMFHLLQASSLQLKSVMQDVDKMLIRSAWLDAKLGYIVNRQAFNRDSLLTFVKTVWQRDQFRNYMRMREERAELNLEEKSEKVNFIPDDQVDVNWVDDNKVNLNSMVSCYSYLFELEKESYRIYREELELIIMFQLLIVTAAENLQEQKRKYLFTFLQEKKAALFALGIVIYVPDHGNMAIRYARVITQIQKLSPEKQTMFNHLRDQFIQEERLKEEKVKEAARIEEEKERLRQELQEQMSKKKKNAIKNFNYDMPVDEMPDCRQKYLKILEEADGGKLFTDVQFKADDEALGAGCLNRGVAKWVRARDKPQCRIFKDKIDHLDVVQGALGDCYFLSAISVLGEKFVRKIIQTTDEEWRKSGCFHVVFYRYGEPEDIIIDDFFPAYANDDWIFVKGGADGDELWPMILEKAYAKMYGSFNYIEAGKVQYALSDMTDGFPEQIDLKVEGQNLNSLWEKIKVLDRHGSLMGAGSPENALGDRAINELGIVQGHAYAILDIQEVDGHRLMQLRNPHGSKGVEWNGDWSDTCEKWDQRMRNKLGYQDANADGVFWMELQDFVQQFSFLYICRLLDEEDGWVERKVRGEWKGASAEGLPSRKNPNARLDFNPQYEITVTKPCDGFISLTQFNRINMFKGKNSIFFMVSKVGGKHITKVEKATLVCKSGNPINLNIITAECDFDKSVKYPYKFTLMIANTEKGEAGEGEFEVAVYATDKNVKIEPLKPPKDFPK